jgi:methyltransferase (TIGR00027 family)
LGAGLDTFAQRRPGIAAQLTIFEVDQPGPQRWKQRRLIELGYDVPNWLRFAPVDFEAGDSWWTALRDAGFHANEPAVITSTGVSMYLTQEAIQAMLRQIATFARGSTLATTFVLPVELADAEDRPGYEAAIAGARASGTPFISFFTPEHIAKLAREAGFREVATISPSVLNERYFSNRADGLRLSGTSEQFLIAKT